MTAVVLKEIRKAFGPVEILHGVDLEIQEGEFIVFVGPSGCGKSTLLRCIAGLEETSGGDLFINNVRVNELPPAKRGIAMVFQSYALYPHMTVEENIAFGLKLTGMNKGQIKEAVHKVARILQLEPLLERKPKALSGGQRQRVAIGRALVRKPSVFLFDEPLSNLDAGLRVQMRIEIAALHRELGVTMIYVTHDQVEAMTLASRIVVLNAGNIEQVGSPLALYHAPANRFVAGFIGSPKMNFLEGTLISADSGQATVKLTSGENVLVSVDAKRGKPGEKVTLGVRSEHLHAVPEDSSSTEMNRFGGTLMAQERLGDLTYLYVTSPNSEHPLSLRADPGLRIKLQTRLNLYMAPEDCHLFAADGQAFARQNLPDLTDPDHPVASAH